MATQRTVKQRARTLQAEAKERGENLPYTAALRMAEAHGITPKRPAGRTLVQVLESLFTDDHQLFISASDDLERLKAEGLEEVFEDEEVEAFTVQQGNVYEAILTEWSVYDTPAQAMSVYGYTDENDLSNLTEHRLVDVWWELGHFKKLGDEYENKVTAVFAATEGAGEPTASYILSGLERFDMEELLAEVLGDALKVSNPNVFEDVLGDVSEMLSLEFMALLAHPYIGKYEGWTQEAYGKVVAFWNENFDTPVHPLDTTETAPSPAVTQGNPQHILKSYDQWHGKELFVYHSGELEMLRQGLDEVLEDEIDGTFTISDNIFQWIIDTHDTIGTPLEELSIYAYPSDQVNELVEYPLVEQWWEVGQWAEIMQHYFSDSNQAVPSPDDMLQHQQRVEAITPALLTALTQGYGLETTDPVLGATVQEDSTFFPSLTALLCRRFIGQYEGWDQAAYDAAAYMWNNYWGTPLHPKDQLPQDAPVQPNPGDAVLAPYSQRDGHLFYYYAPEGTPSLEYAQGRILKFPVQDWAKGLAGFIHGRGLTPVKPALDPSHIALYFYDAKAGTVERVCTVVELFPNVDFAAVARYEAKHRLIFQDPISSTSSAYWKLLGDGSWSCKEYDAWLEIEGLLNTKYRVRYFREINNAFDTVNLISYELMALMGREYLMQSESGRALYDKATSAWRRAVDQLHPDDPVFEPFMLNE